MNAIFVAALVAATVACIGMLAGIIIGVHKAVTGNAAEGRHRRSSNAAEGQAQVKGAGK